MYQVMIMFYFIIYGKIFCGQVLFMNWVESVGELPSCFNMKIFCGVKA